MDDTAGVGDRQRSRHIQPDPDTRAFREATGGDEPSPEGERVPINYDEGGVVDLADVADRDDVAVAQTGRGGRLAPEPDVAVVLPGELGAEYFERDRNVEILIDRLIDPRLRSRAEEPSDPVFAESLP
jgi:hypothetical protein